MGLEEHLGDIFEWDTFGYSLWAQHKKKHMHRLYQWEYSLEKTMKPYFSGVFPWKNSDNNRIISLQYEQ